LHQGERFQNRLVVTLAGSRDRGLQENPSKSTGKEEHEMPKILPLAMLICLLLCVPITGQSWSDGQMEVWKVIEAQWQASMDQDSSWPERFLHESFLGWSDELPAPRDKDSIAKWTRYDIGLSKTHAQELKPIGIVLEGNTAVAHYFYSIAVEDKKGEHKTTHGSYTDVLVKSDGAWKFVAWRGGETPSGD
jgi:hypothetical protein